MKKFFYFLFLLTFIYLIPTHVQAEKNPHTAIPSWEGPYCIGINGPCMRITEQNLEPNSNTTYARIVFDDSKGRIFITEGEVIIKSPHEAEFSLLKIIRSEDGQSMTIVENPAFKSWGNDTIDNYGYSLLLGKYFDME